jgi:uncharacterized protein (DUF58 family)
MGVKEGVTLLVNSKTRGKAALHPTVEDQRVYSEERDRPVLLVVDQRQSLFFGSRRAMKSVVAAEVTALAAWRVLQAGDRVGALVFDDQDVVEILPQPSEQQVLRILGTVVKKNQA